MFVDVVVDVVIVVVADFVAAFVVDFLMILAPQAMFFKGIPEMPKQENQSTQTVFPGSKQKNDSKTTQQGIP